MQIYNYTTNKLYKQTTKNDTDNKRKLEERRRMKRENKMKERKNED